MSDTVLSLSPPMADQKLRLPDTALYWDGKMPPLPRKLHIIINKTIPNVPSAETARLGSQCKRHFSLLPSNPNGVGPTLFPYQGLSTLFVFLNNTFVITHSLIYGSLPTP